MNVFEVFLPQLLLYPNPTDPLNGEAAALLMREPETYKKKVRGAPWHLGSHQLLFAECLCGLSGCPRTDTDGVRLRGDPCIRHWINASWLLCAQIM